MQFLVTVPSLIALKILLFFFVNIIIIESKKRTSIKMSTIYYKYRITRKVDVLEMELMQDYSEIIPYKCPDIPFHINSVSLSTFPDMRALCHWHDDIEWIHILEGKMCYHINGKQLTLNKNDSLMVNARQMHYGYSYQKQECRFSYILFHPSLFCSNHALLEKYITPILENGHLEYLHFQSDHESGQKVSDFLTQMIRLNETAAEGYELEIIALMHMLWIKLYQYKMLLPDCCQEKIPNDMKIQKDMISFLYQNYGEKISLDEIAAAGNVSRSKCCRIFKHYLQQTPIDFLNAYRLKISCRLLVTTDKSISEIALACGFKHLSYFSKFFYNSFGCTPREYRNKNAQK